MKPPPIYISEDGDWWAMEGHQDRSDFLLEVWDYGLADLLELYLLEDEDKADEIEKRAAEVVHTFIRPANPSSPHEDPDHVFECHKAHKYARPATVWRND